MTIYFVFLFQEGYAPLHRAVMYNKVEVAQVLINAGEKRNVLNSVVLV